MAQVRRSPEYCGECVSGHFFRFTTPDAASGNQGLCLNPHGPENVNEADTPIQAYTNVGRIGIANEIKATGATCFSTRRAGN